MTARARPVRALVVERDSDRCTELMQALRRDGDIAVVGQAASAQAAVTLIRQLEPDAVVLDLQMPGGSQHVVEAIMASVPTPILVLSGRLEDRSAPSAVDALVAGAVDALPRPTVWTPDLEGELRRTVRLVSKVCVVRQPRRRGARPLTARAGPPVVRQPVVALAASTGGPRALAILLGGLGGLRAPVLVVQHLHPEFISGLVERLSRASALPVTTAEHGQVPRTGHVYVAPGGLHLRLAANFRLQLDAHPVTIHRPSADQLFRSVAAQANASAIGVLLTGMGDDGAQGLLEIRSCGGRTLAQDEESCVVFGMPNAAQRLGAVTDMLPLSQLADAVQRTVREVIDEQ